MNLWKPIAIVSVAGLALSVATHFESPASADTPAVCKNQPHMAAAVASLRAAKGSLEQAEHNKGGWRAAAAGQVQSLIDDTIKGCAYADAHPNEH
ncbi:MAG TPA: hypothetical protein VIF15_01655 [Polyangiaceae bacterium]|jgi:hypothetical protein